MLHLSNTMSAVWIKEPKKMANLIKFGTYNPKYIWMLRYGMSFEDIEVLEDYIESIDEQGIIVNQAFANLPEKARDCIKRFVD